MLTKNLRPCPICGQSFSHLVLTKHVNSCLDKQEFDPDLCGETGVAVTCDEVADPPRKRAKCGSETSGEDKNATRSMADYLPEKTVPSSKQSFNKTSLTSPTRPFKTESIQSTLSPKSRKFVWPERKPATQTLSESVSKNMSTQSNCSKNLFMKDEHESIQPKNKTHPNTHPVATKQDPGTSSLSDSQTWETALTFDSKSPLADQMRPNSISEYVGQDKTVGKNKLLRELLESHQIPSMIFWGPPGCGKTTLAKIVAKKSKESHNTRFVQISATTSGVADVKEVIKIAKNELKMWKRKTILFVDEIHRFNKLQQDTFLPHVEDGTITLLGATTENPSFQVNNALLSRCRVVVLEKLNIDDILAILKRALMRLRIAISTKTCDGEGGFRIQEDALSCLANFCDGDARGALNGLETVVRSKRARNASGNNNQTTGAVITVENVKEVLQRTHVQYDRAGDEHYHCASALQKSIRGSDDNGAIYWMTRMFDGGEDPLFIARRLLVCASEDIGMADPQALPIAMATFHACQVLGRPECAINLAHCTTYLARAPKSYEAVSAMLAARKCILEHEGALPGVPLHLRNATSKLARELGYGKGYKHYDAAGTQEYLPKELLHMDFYSRRGKPS